MSDDINDTSVPDNGSAPELTEDEEALLEEMPG